MTETEENLKIAFAKESRASQRYRAFSKRARKDGYLNVARLVSEVERIHAQNNLNALNKVAQH